MTLKNALEEKIVLASKNILTESESKTMESIAISGMVGFCLGYLVCMFLIAGRDSDGKE